MRDSSSASKLTPGPFTVHVPDLLRRAPLKASLPRGLPSAAAADFCAADNTACAWNMRRVSLIQDAASAGVVLIANAKFFPARLRPLETTPPSFFTPTPYSLAASHPGSTRRGPYSSFLKWQQTKKVHLFTRCGLNEGVIPGGSFCLDVVE